jgi:hypothetical protein
MRERRNCDIFDSARGNSCCTRCETDPGPSYRKAAPINTFSHFILDSLQLGSLPNFAYSSIWIYFRLFPFLKVICFSGHYILLDVLGPPILTPPHYLVCAACEKFKRMMSETTLVPSSSCGRLCIPTRVGKGVWPKLQANILFHLSQAGCFDWFSGLPSIILMQNSSLLLSTEGCPTLR